jgi:hypothetical protein
MTVLPGDELEMAFELKSGTHSVWSQIVKNLCNGQSVTFDIDMKGQTQGWALWALETVGGWFENPPQFFVLRATAAGPSFCAYI